MKASDVRKLFTQARVVEQLTLWYKSEQTLVEQGIEPKDFFKKNAMTLIAEFKSEPHIMKIIIREFEIKYTEHQEWLKKIMVLL